MNFSMCVCFSSTAMSQKWFRISHTLFCPSENLGYYPHILTGSAISQFQNKAQYLCPVFQMVLTMHQYRQKKVGVEGEQNMTQVYIFQRNRTHWLTLGTGQWWAFVDVFCEAIALHVVLCSCYSKHHVRPRCCQEKRDYHWGFTGILRWIGCPNCLFLLHRFVLLVYTLAPCPGPAVMGW